MKKVKRTVSDFFDIAVELLLILIVFFGVLHFIVTAFLMLTIG